MYTNYFYQDFQYYNKIPITKTLLRFIKPEVAKVITY